MNIPKNMRRYHYKLYFPESLPNMLGEFIGQFRESFESKDPEPTYHGAEQLFEDNKARKHGLESIPLPTFQEIFNPKNTLVEFYEILDRNNNPTGKIQKALIRLHEMHSKLDFTYVVAREGFIVSAWANEKEDDHRLTESKTKYYKP